MKNKRLLIMAVFLVLSIANFARMSETESIKATVFISIFVIGAFEATLGKEIVDFLKK